MSRSFSQSTLSSATFILLSAILLPASASADSISKCKHAKQVNEKLRACSAAIAQTSEPDQLERLYLRRGNAFMELKLYAEAKQDFTRLISINPNVAGYFDNRLMASRELGQMQDALADANREVALAPHMTFTHRNRGLLFEIMMDYPRALKDMNEAATLTPSDSGVIIDRARIKTKLGRTSEGIQDLNALIAREPANLWAYRERGLAYLLVGDSVKAEQDLSFYARTAPDDDEIRSTLVMIRGQSRSTSPSPNTVHDQRPRDKSLD